MLAEIINLRLLTWTTKSLVKAGPYSLFFPEITETDLITEYNRKHKLAKY